MDLIYSFGVLHHTPNIEKAIANIYKLLADGGTFKLMLYAKNSWKYFKIKEKSRSSMKHNQVFL